MVSVNATKLIILKRINVLNATFPVKHAELALKLAVLLVK